MERSNNNGSFYQGFDNKSMTGMEPSFDQEASSQITTAAAVAAATAVQIISSIHQSPQQTAQNKYMETNNPNKLAIQVVTAAAAAALNNQNNSKHSSQPIKAVCSICGDKASGKHYGVNSCEGCKGFFKRTVRKDLTYTCRDTKQCIVDKRQRNRCQYCRYHKCLSNGMKREAVQDERQKYNFKNDIDRFSSPSSNDFKDEIKEVQIVDDLMDDIVLTNDEKEFLKKITQAEALFNPDKRNSEQESCSIDTLYQSLEMQLNRLPDWAKSIDKFQELETDDQVSLLRGNWREILSCSVAHRSLLYDDVLLLANGSIFSVETCSDESLKYLLQRLLEDIINIMKDLDIDRVELALLKLILLFDPDAKNLKDHVKINETRDSICMTLSKYCRRDQYANDPCRFAQLLMRLPPLRSWILKGAENFMSIKAANSLDNILVEAFVKKQTKI